MRDINPAAIAYHESGHAVAALALGCVVRKVEIAPNAVTSCRYGDNKRTAALHHAMIALAGQIAEDRGCPGSPRGDSVDRRHAYDAAVYVASDHPEAFLQGLHFGTRELVDRHWAYVEVLAAALLRHRRLTGHEISVLFSL